MATTMTNAMHPPMIPHNSPSVRPDVRAPPVAGSLLSTVVDSVDSAVGGSAAKQN